jgi:hypothetical protein
LCVVIIVVVIAIIVFAVKKKSRILEFLFKGLVFLMISFSLSILLNSRDSMERVGFSNANMCLDIPRHFLLMSRESVCDDIYIDSVFVFGRTFLISKGVCGRNTVSMRDTFINSSLCLGMSILSSILFISFIFLSVLSLCLGFSVLKFSFSILSICIWLNLMNAKFLVLILLLLLYYLCI